MGCRKNREESEERVAIVGSFISFDMSRTKFVIDDGRADVGQRAMDIQEGSGR